MELAYDGTNYHGWQIQPNATTVQETLEKALSTLLKEEIAVTGAGRTDTGVHASWFVAHFDVTTAVADELQLTYKLNRFLPADIRIYKIFLVDDRLHARFSATYREYRYMIRSAKPVFNRDYCHYHYGELDLDKMNQAAEALFSYTDFTSFSKLHTDVKTNDCKIMAARWEKVDEGYEFTIRADRFLRNMVRSIVGTMLEVGTGKITLEEFRGIIEAKDRGRAGMSAEARGLFLTDIGYPTS